LSYVSIWKPVHDRIVQAARDTRTTEIIGLLIGRLKDDTIIIQDSTTGEFSSEPHRVTLPASSLAKIADDIVTGRLKGNIVGWYHSHTAGGLFFSETDVATQTKLQQFSSLITGLVVDASNGEVGYFRVIPQSGTAIRIPNENIKVYAEEQDALPVGPAAAPVIPPTPTVEVRRRPPRQTLQLQPNRLTIAVILVALIVSIALIGALIYNAAPRTSNLTISHNPVLKATIGTPIPISANTTGTTRNVTLVYSVISGSESNVSMSSIGPGEYGYTIPGTEVTGNIAYYIKAFDTQGNEVKTATYNIAVADFSVITQSSSLTVYRTKSVLTQIILLAVNNFNEPVILSSTGAPTGLIVAFASNPVSPESVELNFTATELAPNGTYPITVSATYAPPQSAPVARQVTLEVTVADFYLQVSPTSSDLHPGSTASLTVTLTLEKGFVDPITINVVDLPQGATYTLTNSNPTILAGPGTTTITLQIKAPLNIKVGTYSVLIQASGAGIIHNQPIELIVR
jgi:proteasome lid subunit RPN8/RPN11